MNIALVVGHKKSSPGAFNKTYRISEFEFNNSLVDSIISSYNGNFKLIKVLRNKYKNLPFEINKLDPYFIVSFHANAFNTQVSGTETLYYHKSSNGKYLAGVFQNNMVNILKLKNRGIKPKSAEDRGGYLLKYTKAPCIIVEPFFIDNNQDLELVLRKRSDLVLEFCKSIDSIKF